MRITIECRIGQYPIALALDRLEAAVRLRDDRLEQLRVDPLLDPLRNEPRFRAIERQLKFPN